MSSLNSDMGIASSLLASLFC